MQHHSSKLSSFFKYINKITNFLAGLIAFLLLTVVLLQIFGRFTDNSAAWTEEMTRYIFIWMIFFGLAIGLREGESPRVTFLLNILPKTFQKIGRAIYIVSTIGFLLFMIVYGIQMVLNQINTNETSSVLMFPIWIIGISIPLSGLLGIINTIQLLIYNRELI